MNSVVALIGFAIGSVFVFTGLVGMYLPRRPADRPQPTASRTYARYSLRSFGDEGQ